MAATEVESAVDSERAQYLSLTVIIIGEVTADLLNANVVNPRLCQNEAGGVAPRVVRLTTVAVEVPEGPVNVTGRGH